MLRTFRRGTSEKNHPVCQLLVSATNCFLSTPFAAQHMLHYTWFLAEMTLAGIEQYKLACPPAPMHVLNKPHNGEPSHDNLCYWVKIQNTLYSQPWCFPYPATLIHGAWRCCLRSSVWNPPIWWWKYFCPLQNDSGDYLSIEQPVHMFNWWFLLTGWSLWKTSLAEQRLSWTAERSASGQGQYKQLLLGL